MDGGREAGPSPRPGRGGVATIGSSGPGHIPVAGRRARAAERSRCWAVMAWQRPPRRGCGSLQRCLLGAALLLGLRLCAELRRASLRPPASSAPPGRAPRPPRPHLPPAPGLQRGASWRQVTYVRSGRRAPPGGGGSGTPKPCCAPHGSPRRKVSGKRCSLGVLGLRPSSSSWSSLQSASLRPRRLPLQKDLSLPLLAQRSFRQRHWWHPSTPRCSEVGLS